MCKRPENSKVTKEYEEGFAKISRKEFNCLSEMNLMPTNATHWDLKQEL